MANQYLFYSYLALMIIMSLIAIIFYCRDKKLAIKQKIRIKEKTLLFFACFNGAIGSYFGRKIAHHKTDKVYFSIVIYMGMFIQIATLIVLAALCFFKR